MMQRDMKIGMALGLALVGIVGALFFRRDAETKKDAPPPLQSAEELDRQIAEKAKPPYIKGLEDFADSTPPAPPPSAGAGKASSKTDPYEVPSFLTKEDEAKNRELLSRKSAPAPDPIQPVPPAADPAVAGTTGPAHNRDWESTGPAAKKAGDSPRPGAAPAAGRTHVIRSGETLSGLAARYLGSSARFREIYEANRNVLKNPDDLPDGVTIVIPEGKPRDPQHTAGSPMSTQGGIKARKALRTTDGEDDRTPTENASTGTAPREKIRFVPVNRGPFSAGRTAAPPSDSGSHRKTPAPRGSTDLDDDEP